MYLVSTLALLVATLAPTRGGEAERIAFSRLVDGFWQIATVRPDGSDERCWTSTPWDKRHPSWSGQGDFLVFCDTGGALYRIDAPGQEPRRILAEQSPIAEPALSGTNQLAYMKVRKMPAYLLEVWTCGLDGSSPRLLTPQPLRQLSPAWSPDGTQVVLSQFDMSTTSSMLVVMNPDGSAPRTVLAGKERVTSPSWSPDGKSLVFAREERGEHDIWTIETSGQGLRRLTNDPGLDSTPRFSPDGSRVVFVSRRSGSLQLWSVPSTGGAATKITGGDLPAREPEWFAPPRVPLSHLGAVEVPKRTLDVIANEKVEVRFTLDKSARVDLEVLDDAQKLVRTLSSTDLLAAGTHSLAWDGRDERGAPAKPGVHLLRLTYRGEDGIARWDPSSESGGTSLDVADAKLDIENHRIHFTLRGPGWVRVRLGLDKGPLIATLLDWRPTPAGPTFVEYEGNLPAPWGSFWELPDRSAWISCYAMPDNAVIVTAKGGVNALPGGRPNLYSLTKRELFPHARHTRESCRDPQIQVRALPLGKGGEIPSVTDELSFSVDTLNAVDRAQFETGRFEVAAYVDGQFLFEDEDSALPFNFRFDVRTFSEGPHALLVNVTSDQEHMGSAFLPFVVHRGTK